MNQIPITVKIDADLKSEVQSLAKNMGLSVSAIVENKLREVVRDRRIVFKEDLTPNAETAQRLREIERDIQGGRNISKALNSIDELEAHLNRL